MCNFKTWTEARAFERVFVQGQQYITPIRESQVAEEFSKQKEKKKVKTIRAMIITHSH